MTAYHVTYFYLATGMEGRADIEDYGTVDASSSTEAKLIAARRRHPNMSADDLDFTVGCLTTETVT